MDTSNTYIFNAILKSHIVTALEYSGVNHNEVSLLVPLQLRAFVGAPPGQPDVLMIQTPDGCKVVNPGDYIVKGRFGAKLGFFVFTKDEFQASFDVLIEPSSSISTEVQDS